MKNQRTFLTFFIMLGFSILQAQVTQQWVGRYNGTGNGNDEATSLAVDGIGNVYVTGNTATIKYNTNGDSLWVRNHGGKAIALDNSGNVYITGSSTIKYNTNGDSLWGINLGLSIGGNAIVLDGSGNVYVTGSINYAYFSLQDYLTIKINSSGVVQWGSEYNYLSGSQGYSFDVARAICVDSSGNVYVTGGSQFNQYSLEYATIKYDSSGMQQWVQRNGSGFGRSIAVDSSGNVYVTGEGLTIKYNPNGYLLWDRYGLGFAMVLDGSGNVYVTGDNRTLKYNTNGDTLWVRYGGSSRRSNAIVLDGFGNVYVTGSIYVGEISPSFDYETIKYNSSGIQQWIKRYDGPVSQADGAVSLAVDGSRNVYVTGFSDGVGTAYDYATIKYFQENPLPVELISFTSNVNKRDVTLNWTTTSETNNSGFDVERSIVNGQWSMVGNVRGNETTSSPKNYSFTDKGLNSGKYNYRLKQIDFNGNFEYFNLSNEVNVGIPDKFDLSQNYPNPFNPSTKINYDLPIDAKVSLKLFDISGREVMTLVNQVQAAGYYTVTFNAATLSSGVYFYRLNSEKNGNYTESKKMTLIK